MNVSEGTCRLCHSTQKQQTSLFANDQDQQQRRRPRRHRHDNSSQEQQEQHRPTQQPMIVMIQYEEDNPREISRNNEPILSTDNSTMDLQNLGIILCKWLPTSLPFHHLSSKAAAGDKIESNAESGTDILEFDESVQIFLKEECWRIDGLLRLCSEDNNSDRCESWILGETDPESVHRSSSGHDQWDGRDNNHPSHCSYLTIENNRERPCRRHKGVAIPLFSPSVTIRPLQSLVISIIGLADAKSRSQKLGDHESDSDDRMLILMQTFWKRQLVGKVVAFDDQWTSQIRLIADINNKDDMSTNSDVDNAAEGTQPITNGKTVYAVIESCTPLTLSTWSPTLYSKRGNDNKETLFLPNNLFMVLPSTYITIQPASQQQSPTQSSLGFNPDTTRSSQSANICRQSILRPPTPAASLLMDTLNCIRSRGIGDGDVPRTFLLSGPPGVGKTFSVSWAAKAHPDTLVCSIRGSELLRGSGDESSISPARALELEFLKLVEAISLRERQNTKNGSAEAGLIFLDECDALVSVKPIAAMLADLLDRVSSTKVSLSSSEHGVTNDVDQYWKRIIVVGATNRIDSIPTYLRRAGRFDREIPMSPPSAEKRAKLLCSLLVNLQGDGNNGEKTNKFTLPSPDEIQKITELCVGYVAADLSALVRKAWLLFWQEKNENCNNGITVSHLEAARNLVGASALRDASLASPPKMTWNDIAGDPGGAKTALRQAIEWPRLKAREFAMLGLQPCRGILLHGPPGCAKTTLARAAAGSSGVAFLSLSPAQVYASSYVGEAERIVRRAFHLARATAPCILFFDEIDSIFGNSSSSGNDGGGMGGSGRGSSAEARVLSTFLNEMDGVDIAGAGKDGVLVLGATNRPWTLDSALLRPGRLGDKIIFLPPPDKEARCSIFEMQFGNVTSVNNSETVDEMSWDLDFSILVDLSEGMTGAEIVGACQEAKIQWMRVAILNLEPVGQYNINDDEFGQQDCIVNTLLSIKPLLSNPEALEEFRVFENMQG